MGRRLLVWEFDHKVPDKESNPNLHKELEAEIGRLLLKFNIAYRCAAREFAGRNIWSVLPDYFKSTQRNMMAYKPLVSQDFYFAYGVVPPRKFNPSRPPAQPQWNAWGSCVDTSCTYVPLKQRYDGYSKYSQRIERGFRGFRALKDTLKRGDWEAAAAQVELSPPAGTQPSPTVDMLLKAALLASQLLVSPNNLKEIQEAALARFYVNEAAYALELISRAVAKQDREAALFAYDFGRDSWNSYIAVINRAIPEKVGDKFEPLPS